MSKPLRFFQSFMLAMAGLGLTTLASANLVEGQHYERLPEPIETQVEEGKIEVTEVFWYGCPHCYNLQPSISEWYTTLDEDVEVIHMPATMGGDWNTHAVMFYAAEALDIREEAHADIFHALHEEGQRLDNANAIASFFTQYGVSEEQAREALDSFGVKAQINQAHSRMRAMRLMGVPALVIDGRYVVSPSSAGSLDNMPQVADALIERIREERGN